MNLSAGFIFILVVLFFILVLPRVLWILIVLCVIGLLVITLGLIWMGTRIKRALGL